MIDWTAFAAVTTAIAALAAAVVWPLMLFLILCVFKNEIRAIVGKLPLLMDRVEILKVAGIEAELRYVAKQASELTTGTTGQITPAQVQAAVRIQQEAEEIGRHELALKMDRLGREYDLLRRTAPRSTERTRSMTAIFVQMRALGPSVADRLDAFKTSGSPGSRLAAIAIMQMQPTLVDLPWLVERFKSDQPFVFYHASLAMQNAANDADAKLLKAVQAAANAALEVLQAYDGAPDAETVHVLTGLTQMSS